MRKPKKVSLGRSIIDLCLKNDAQFEQQLFQSADSNPFMLGIIWVQLAEQEWRYAVCRHPKSLQQEIWRHALQIRQFLRKKLGDAEFDRFYRREHSEDSAVTTTTFWDHNVPMFDDEGKPLESKKATARAVSLGGDGA